MRARVAWDSSALEPYFSVMCSTMFWPSAGHARVQFERLEVDLGLHLAAEWVEGFGQAAQADDAPGAGHIADEIDFQGKYSW